MAKAVASTSLRAVADQAGVSHGTVDSFKAGGEVTDKTLGKLEQWAEQYGGAWNGEGTGDDPWRWLDGIDRLDAPEPVKAWRTAEVAATYRAVALADLAAALRLEAKAADARALAVGSHTRAVEKEAESAGTRARAIQWERRPTGAPMLPLNPPPEPGEARGKGKGRA